MSSSVRLLLALCACVLGLASGVHAQGLTGQMSGSVVDASQAGAARRDRHGDQRRHAGEPDGHHGYERPLHGDRAAGRALRGHGHPGRLQDLRAARRRAVGQRARRAAADRARGRHAERDDRGDGRSGARPDAQRRALRHDHAGSDPGRLAQGPRLHGHAAARARRRRHAEPRGPRLEQPGRHQHQRRAEQHRQPDLRRRHQPRHRIEHRAVPRARPRLDRRDQGADLELPGGVRAQLRRHDQRRDQERRPRLPRRRLLFAAQRGLQRQRVAEQQVRPAEAAVSVRLQRLSHRRAGAPARRLQQRAQQAVLLLEPGVPAAHEPGQPRTADDADRARAARRLLAIVRHQRPADRHPRSADRAAVPGQHHPDQPHRRERPGAC